MSLIAPHTVVQELLSRITAGADDADSLWAEIEALAKSQQQNRLPDGAIVNPDGTVHYSLRWPISYEQGGSPKTISSVTVRRKNMGDLMAIKNLANPVDIGAVTLQRLTGLLDHEMNRMDDVDCDAIGDIIEGFTRPGRATGSGASA